MVVLAGITRIMEYANLGMGCSIHQYNVIGPYSIVATGAAIIKNVKPFLKYIPGKPISVNKYAIDKFGFGEYIDEISAYVIDGKIPTSEKIGGVVERYRKYHIDSGRSEY
jgi:UDP-N-acetylglucosamine acyltransferase